MSIGLIVKLIFVPIVTIIVCKIFGWSGLAAIVSILEVAMTPMITASAVASMAGLAPRLSASIIEYGILFSFFNTYIFKLLIL